MPASNTEECIRQFFGKKLVGVLVGELHLDDASSFTLVFEGGKGLTVYDTGAWAEAREGDVLRAVKSRRNDLQSAIESAQRMADLVNEIDEPTVLNPTKPKGQKARKSKAK